MGIIIPKESDASASGASDNGSDFGDNIAVLPPTDERPAGGPDASMLSRADFPHRDMPDVKGTRDARYQVVFRQCVLDEIHAHGKTSMESEVCGVLIGDVYFDRLAGWAYIEHCIRGNDADGKQTQVTITSETWSRIHETLEKEYPGKKIVGWYHTHPGFGIFLSGMDLFIQDNFFNQPWQVATVYDPHSEDEGTFIWRDGKSVRENILVEVESDSIAAAAAEPQQEHATASSSEAVTELTRRIKRLERRVDFILTGFLFLILLALVSPLILFALSPESLKKQVPILRRALDNGILQPDKAAPAADPKSAAPGAGKGASPATAPADAAPHRAEPR